MPVCVLEIPFAEDLDRDIDESSLEKLPYRHNRFRVRIRQPDLDDSRAVIEEIDLPST